MNFDCAAFARQNQLRHGWGGIVKDALLIKKQDQTFSENHHRTTRILRSDASRVRHLHWATPT
jgi:hypothetical protein